MSAAALMNDLARLGICIEVRGERLRYAPRSAVTPDLAQRMKAHKPELLVILRSEADRTGNQPDMIDPPDPCPECGTLELWQTLAGNWRCQQCDPPTTARRLLELAARLKSDGAESRRTNVKADR